MEWFGEKQFSRVLTSKKIGMYIKNRYSLSGGGTQD
jgi:hypothetical protein